MTRFFCSTDRCRLLAAQLCHAQQQIATLAAQLATVQAERDAAQEEAAALAAQLAEARGSVDFYMDLFCSAREARRV